MNRPVLILVLAAALAFAGCLGGGSEADSAADGAETGSDANDPDRTGGGGADDAEGDESSHWNATLGETPPWSAGQWWTAEVSDVNADETYTVQQVVASKHGDFYDVGLAAEDWSVPVLIAHWPPIGELGSDLSYPIHNSKFHPVKFPIEEGKTWETTYLGIDGFTAEVQSVDGLTAEIEATNEDNDTISWTYDAEMETVTRLEDFLGLQYQVTDHGHDYTGDVVVPHGKSQYISGRFLGAFDFTFGPNTPEGSLDVSEPQASAAVIAGSVSPTSGSPPPPGYYQETVTTPGDNTTTLRTTGTSGLEVQYMEIQNAQGTWEFDHVAGGYGAAATEIVAYDKFTTTLTGDEASTSS